MRKIKCNECKTWHAGFHLCNGKVWSEYSGEGTPFDRETIKKVMGKLPSPNTTKRTLGPEHRAAMAEGARRNWARRHAKTAQRDAYIVERYTSDESVTMVAIGQSIAEKGYGKNLTRAQVRVVLERFDVPIRNNQSRKARQS